MVDCVFGIMEGVLSENLIKASEAAEKIGVSLVTVKRMIRDGRLAGEKVGNRWQVIEQSVYGNLLSRRRRPRQAAQYPYQRRRLGSSWCTSKRPVGTGL